MDFDVIIVGAGPAGSTCARECAQQGISTLLLDRDTFPRAKPCGGALSERGLSHLGFPLPPELIERECFGARVHYGHNTVECRKNCRIAVMVSREKFDHYLAERAVDAGSVLRQGEAAREVSASKDRVEVRTDLGQYRARCLIGADGANSVVGRTIRPMFGRDEISVALVSATTADNREIDSHLDGFLDLYFGVAAMGYGWVFPHKGYYSVGVMGLASELSAPQKVFADFIRDRGMDAARPQGHTIPWGGVQRAIVGRRAVLVGDAAGFADPFHGEGIANAILSGKLAAQAVVDGIKGKKDALAWYEKECDRLIVREMKVALSMARLLERYPKLFLAVFFSDTTALDKYLDIAAGRTDYVQFRKWLLPRLPRYLIAMLFGGAVSRT